ncbi:putative glycerol-3-phosphate dehydrogenase, mitochondrial [Portunus trituberculatus]|uniref:Putative glycerol-3-phosphate dehydrogenase, mitochondrial n=1 Tax=Portunus trituberculatus TaxID=210409 RepID=A0A5B7JN86_PORTR|nr:putative glycerol-3-phosphate dehydrogenase, mitochondrial [Portunus trituberculatus]
MFLQRQLEAASKYLQQEMGQNVNRASREKIPINLSKSEISEYVKRFNSLDTDKKGYISLNDLRASLKVRSLVNNLRSAVLMVLLQQHSENI